MAVDWLGVRWRAAAVGLIETIGYMSIAISNPVVAALPAENSVAVNYSSLLGIALICRQTGAIRAFFMRPRRSCEFELPVGMLALSASWR